MSDNERIDDAAKEILSCLETPINGQPSVVVRNRKNAERLIKAALSAIWDAVTSETEQS